MPKYRKLHTKVVESFDVHYLPDDLTRLFWVLLPTQLCREGRGIDNAAWLISRVFPLRDDINKETIEQAMKIFAQQNMIVRYEHKGRRYFAMVNWAEYQGNTVKEAPSSYPAPDLLQTNSGLTPDKLQTNSGTDADADADAVFSIQYSDAAAVVEDSPQLIAAAAALKELQISNPKRDEILKANQHRKNLLAWIADHADAIEAGRQSVGLTIVKMLDGESAKPPPADRDMTRPIPDDLVDIIKR